jgi:hypothetical protein
MSARATLNALVKRLPGIKAVVAERDKLRQDSGFVPPGHFYSPIPSLSEIERDDARIFGTIASSVPGVDLRESEQLALLHTLADYYPDLPFREAKTEGLRYYFDNPAYSYSDAICLFCMIRHLKPKRIIEIGSGYSSCVTLDTNQLFFDGAIKTTFVEPFPDLLMSLVTAEDKRRITVIPQRLQDVALDEFKALGPNDILFVDSTHVAKINSDVNRVFFEILPVLSAGVYVHVHDVFYPFEYPREWIYHGRAWNEMYLLRAFLQYNSAFRVVLMNTYMERFHEAFFRERMPLCLRNLGGSIWIRKD